MNKKLYTKPQVDLRRVAPSNAIANRCWSPSHADTFRGWYNDPGWGGVKFEIGSDKNSCNSSFTILGFCDNEGNVFTDPNEFLSHHVGEYTSANLESSLYAEIIKEAQTGGNQGQNFDNPQAPIWEGDPPPQQPWSK